MGGPVLTQSLFLDSARVPLGLGWADCPLGEVGDTAVSARPRAMCILCVCTIGEWGAPPPVTQPGHFLLQALLPPCLPPQAVDFSLLSCSAQLPTRASERFPQGGMPAESGANLCFMRVTLCLCV